MTYDKEKQREYSQAHYRNYKKQYQERDKVRKRLIRKVVIELKLDQACADCGVVYPHWILQFDHRTGTVKKFQLGDTGSIGSVKVLLEEADKCDIVCANCHFNRTYHRNLAG